MLQRLRKSCRIKSNKQLYAVHVTRTVQFTTDTTNDVGSAPFRVMHVFSTSVFDMCEDCFLAKLPTGLSLLPDSHEGVYYDIPKDSAYAPPSQKLLKLIQGETAELNRQILSQHTQPFPAAGKRLHSIRIQPKSSFYGF